MQTPDSHPTGPVSPIGRRGFLAAGAAAIGAAGLGPGLGHFGTTGKAHAGTLAAALGDRGFGRPLRKSYGLNDEIVYLNHASVGTMPTHLIESWTARQRQLETDPAFYVWEDGFGAVDDNARRYAASILGASIEGVALLPSTTVGMSTLAAGLDLGPGDEVLYSSLNHMGAYRGFEHHAKARGYSVRRFDIPAKLAAEVTAEEFVALHTEQIRDETRMLLFPHIDNRLGILHPAEELTGAAKAAGVEYVAIDAAQSLGAVRCNMDEIGCDFVAASGHKWIQGPKQTGILAMTEPMTERVRPTMVTWGQDRFRGARRLEDYGTPDPARAIALSEAIFFQFELGFEAGREYRLGLARAMRDIADNENHLEWLGARDDRMLSPIAPVGIKGRNPRAMRLSEFGQKDRRLVFRAFDEDPDEGGLRAARLSFNLANSVEDAELFAERARPAEG